MTYMIEKANICNDLRNLSNDEFCEKYEIEEKILTRIFRSIYQIRDDYGKHKQKEYEDAVVDYILNRGNN